MLPSEMPRLERPPVTLRAFEDRDAPLVARASEDPLIPLITTVPTTPTPTEVEAYLQRQRDRLPTGNGYSFTVADAETDEAVGQIGLWTSDIAAGRATTGYWIAEPFRRQGYARAALRAVTEWAFTFDDVARLQLHVEPWNEGSWRTAEACGYHKEGLLRSWEQVGAERRDMFVYSVVRADRAGQISRP